MSRDSRATDAATTTEGDEALDATFEALADPDCRAILGVADAPMTTREIADACDIALSTAYRKVDRLSETPLLAEGVRFDPEGDHAAEYVRDTTSATVELDGDGVSVTVDESETAPSDAAFRVSGVSAD